MRNIRTITAVATALLALSAPAATAGGQTADGMTAAGWNCFAAGATNWIHCIPGSANDGNASATTLRVFSEDGSRFLGTEKLLSADAYHGQPCTTDGGGTWADLSGTGDGPYACHNFDTGH